MSKNAARVLVKDLPRPHAKPAHPEIRQKVLGHFGAAAPAPRKTKLVEFSDTMAQRRTRATSHYASSVFINVPFDRKHQKHLRCSGVCGV